MATRGLFVIKLLDEIGNYSYYTGYSNFSKQLRQAKIYVIKERAIEVANNLMKKRDWYTQKPIFTGKYSIIEVELREKDECYENTLEAVTEEFEQLDIDSILNI